MVKARSKRQFSRGGSLPPLCFWKSCHRETNRRCEGASVLRRSARACPWCFLSPSRFPCRWSSLLPYDRENCTDPIILLQNFPLHDAKDYRLNYCDLVKVISIHLKSKLTILEYNLSSSGDQIRLLFWVIERRGPDWNFCLKNTF